MAALRRCDLLLGLDDAALAKIANLPSSSAETYQAGTELFKEGDTAEHLYILDEGYVNLGMDINADPRQSAVVETVTKGSVFGWSALVPPYVYTHSGICTGLVKVAVIRGNELRSLMDNDHHIGYEVMKGLVRVISARLRLVQRQYIKSRRRMIL